MLNIKKEHGNEASNVSKLHKDKNKMKELNDKLNRVAKNQRDNCKKDVKHVVKNAYIVTKQQETHKIGEQSALMECQKLNAAHAVEMDKWPSLIKRHLYHMIMSNMMSL